ncbi:MAG: DUF4340 domain-containing protein [Acidobacteria bacterium]|nr:DUF4340 domain-containing protein [Acidobacteriota bacterium]
MVGGKKLLFLIGIFAALGAFVYFYEIRGREEREKQEAERSKLVQIRQEKATRVSVIRPNEPALILEKNGDRWLLSQPVQADADKWAVEGLLQALADVSTTHTIEKPDLAKYGLKDPAVTITVEEGEKKQTVRFGDKDFTGGSIYAARNEDPQVFLVPDTAYSKAIQPVTDFRDKTVLEFESEGVSQIEIKRRQDTVLLKKEKDAWVLQQPSQERADQSAVDSLVSAIQYGRIQGFADESLSRLKEYGLEPPAVQVILTAGDRKAELNLGASTGENYYAYVPGRTAVFTIAKDIFEKADQPADRFQSRDVVLFERDKIRRLEVQGDKGKWIAEKKGDQWKVTEPAGKEEKSFLEYRFFLALEDLKAETVLKPGSVSLGSPLLVCRASGDISLQVEIFKKGPDWYARSSQSDRIFKITESQANALNEPVDQFLGV